MTWAWGIGVAAMYCVIVWSVRISQVRYRATRERHREDVRRSMMNMEEFELDRLISNLGYAETDWDDFEAKVESILRHGYHIKGLNDNPAPLAKYHCTATDCVAGQIYSSATTISPIPDDEIRKLVNF